MVKRAASMKPARPGGRRRSPVDNAATAAWYDKKMDAVRRRRIADGKPPYVVACRLPEDMIAEFCEPVDNGDGSYLVDADIFCKGELVREEHGICVFGNKWTGDPHFFDMCLNMFSSYWDEIVGAAKAKGWL